MPTLPEVCKHVQEHDRELAVLKERLDSIIRARDLQAQEYERRLGELNHHHEEQKDTLANYGATYVKQELYRQAENEWNVWRSAVDKDMARNQGRSAMLAATVAAVVALASFVGTVLNYFAQSSH